MSGPCTSFPLRGASLLLLAFLALHLGQAKLTNRARDKLQLKPKPRLQEVSLITSSADPLHDYLVTS